MSALVSLTILDTENNPLLSDEKLGTCAPGLTHIEALRQAAYATERLTLTHGIDEAAIGAVKLQVWPPNARNFTFTPEDIKIYLEEARTQMQATRALAINGKRAAPTL